MAIVAEACHEGGHQIVHKHKIAWLGLMKSREMNNVSTTVSRTDCSEDSGNLNVPAHHLCEELYQLYDMKRGPHFHGMYQVSWVGG